MGPGATIAGSASSTGGVAAEGRPLYLWETMVCADGRKRGAMSTEVVVEIDEGCVRKARFAPAHSRELAQPRARKRVTRRRPRGFCHGGGAEGWLPRSYRREVRKRLRDLWGLLAFAVCDFSHEHHDRGELVGKFVQGVGGGVYLVVIRAVGERGVLLNPLREPRRRSRELHLAGLEEARDGVDSAELVGDGLLRYDRDHGLALHLLQ